MKRRFLFVAILLLAISPICAQEILKGITIENSTVGKYVVDKSGNATFHFRQHDSNADIYIHFELKGKLYTQGNLLCFDFNAGNLDVTKIEYTDNGRHILMMDTELVIDGRRATYEEFFGENALMMRSSFNDIKEKTKEEMRPRLTSPFRSQIMSMDKKAIRTARNVTAKGYDIVEYKVTE